MKHQATIIAHPYLEFECEVSVYDLNDKSFGVVVPASKEQISKLKTSKKITIKTDRIHECYLVGYCEMQCVANFVIKNRG